MAKEKIIFSRPYEVQDDTGTVYHRGDVKELPTESCDHFVTRKAAVRLNTLEGQQLKATVEAERKAAKAAAKKTENKEPELDPAKVEKVVEAIGLLDPQKADHYTEAGVPECRALADLVEDPVSAAERDAAFDLYLQRHAENGGNGEGGEGES